MEAVMTDPRRGELVEALCALVAAFEQRETPVSRVDPAVVRWSRGVRAPEDVLTLVDDVRARYDGSAAPHRDEILDQVTRVGVAAVGRRQVRDALTDSLTGLATRARLEEEAQHLIAVAARGRTPLTAVVVDIDGLEKINDDQGHGAGDQAIAQVGRAIRENVRRADRAFRWGGDEFVVLLPATTADEARVLVQRIQRGCGTATTAGVAVHSGFAHDTDVASWLSRADVEMYRHRGKRNRRTVAPRPRLAGTALLVLALTAASTAKWLGATTAGGSARVEDDPGTGAVVRDLQRSPEPAVVPAPAEDPAGLVRTSLGALIDSLG